MNNPGAFRILQLALSVAAVGFLSGSAAAVTNNLTYAAALSRYETSGAVTNIDVTGNAAMTLTLYDSPDQLNPLWSRRMETYVERGFFSVELTDAAGVDDGTRKSRFVKLGELLDQLRPTDALWVGISDLTVDGAPVEGVGAKALPPGCLGGTPFAICAERASGARGDFVVRGDLTTASLMTRGGVTVSDRATFGGQTVFLKDLMFGPKGLIVSGLVQKPTIAGLATVAAETFDLHGTLQVDSLAVTNEAGSVFSTAERGTAPRAVSASEAVCFRTLSAETLGADGTLNIEGGLVLGAGGTFNWTEGRTLRIPDGVYPIAGMPVGVYGTSAYTPSVTAKNSLSTLTVAAGSGAEIVFGTNAWCRLKSSQSRRIVTTVLVPVPRNGTCTSTHGAATASRKELE